MSFIKLVVEKNPKKQTVNIYYKYMRLFPPISVQVTTTAVGVFLYSSIHNCTSRSSQDGYTGFVLGREVGYTIKYTPTSEGVPEVYTVQAVGVLGTE